MSYIQQRLNHLPAPAVEKPEDLREVLDCQQEDAAAARALVSFAAATSPTPQPVTQTLQPLQSLMPTQQPMRQVLHCSVSQSRREMPLPPPLPATVAEAKKAMRTAIAKTELDELHTLEKRLRIQEFKENLQKDGSILEQLKLEKEKSRALELQVKNC